MLSLLSMSYAKLIDLRNRLYDRGVFDSFGLGARTISIGNITAGGTGKTPLVAFIARSLADRGEKVCILTRGYGRRDPKQRVLVTDGNSVLTDERTAGDEPFELAQRLVGKAIIIADADRVAAAEWAKRKFGVTTFLFDDGFQHRRVKRDVDIVCIDATNPFGNGAMLPAGRLREPIDSLARADIIVLTRSDLVIDISNLRSDISTWSGDSAVFAARNQITRAIELGDFRAETQGVKSVKSKDTEDLLDKLQHKKGFAFCGLGNPENFFKQLWHDHFDVPANQTFRDHHIYTQTDITGVEDLARNAGAEILLTTAKDAVKLSDLKFEMPCFVVEIELRIDDQDGFAARL